MLRRNDAMLTAQRQEERWRTAIFRHFPPPLPKVRKQDTAGTAVGPRSDIQDSAAVLRSCRPRSATVRLESKRRRCRTAIVLRRLAMFEYSAPMHLYWHLKFSDGQGAQLRNCAA